MDEKARIVSVIAEAKGDSNLFSLASFKELIEFENTLNSITEYSDTTSDKEDVVSRPMKGKQVSFLDICDRQTINLGNGVIVTKVSPLPYQPAVCACLVTG